MRWPVKTPALRADALRPGTQIEGWGRLGLRVQVSGFRFPDPAMNLVPGLMSWRVRSLPDLSRNGAGPGHDRYVPVPAGFLHENVSGLQQCRFAAMPADELQANRPAEAVKTARNG